MSEPLNISESDGVAILTLNRPKCLNSLSKSLVEQLESKLRAIGERRNVRVVIITGAGERAFSVGMDLKERRDLTAVEKWQQSEPLRRVCDLIWHLPQPVIAAIQGWCLGGGFEIAINCDFRVGAPSAIFAWPEMQLGAFPGGSAAVIFPRLVGRSYAKQMFLTARRVKAEEAFQRGILDHLVSDEAPLARARQLAREIMANSSPLGCAAAKQMINRGSDMSLADAHLLNAALRAPLDATHDYQEGIAAFFQKRPPVWKGE